MAMIKLLKDRIELTALLVTLGAGVALWTSIYEVPLIPILQGGLFSDLLANEHSRSIGSTLAGGIVSAYIFYVLVELIPRYRKEKAAVHVLNKAVNCIVDALETGYLFQHEMPIEFSDSDLQAARLSDNLTFLRYGQRFLNLKSAGHTAETRYQTFKDTLILAASISAAHAESWLVVTDKVRLLAEVMSERPDGDLDLDILSDIRAMNSGKHDRNPTVEYYLSIQQRAGEFIQAAQKWKSLTG